MNGLIGKVKSVLKKAKKSPLSLFSEGSGRTYVLFNT